MTNLNIQRTDWDTYFMLQAHLVATRSTCDRGPELVFDVGRHGVGAIIVKDRRIIATGYNGSPPGLPHCSEVGHFLVENHCVTGDVIIPKLQPKQYSHHHHTVKEIYDMWIGSHRKSGISLMKIRSLSPENVIVGGKIRDIWYVGEKPTVRITTFIGRSITVTIDHRFITPTGYISAANLCEGNKVGLNGKWLVEDQEWLRKRYIDEGLTQLQVAELAGCSRTTVRKRLLKFNIPIKPFHFGGWNKGQYGPSMPWFKGEWSSDANARCWSGNNFTKENCECCGIYGTSTKLIVHHIDRNPHNNDINNLLTLCNECHALAHSPNAKRKTILWDKIVKIQDNGIQPVYDLMTEPYHNFVANGFIVHNCVRTLHSEINAIIQCALDGVSPEGSTIYCTASPCYDCAKAIIRAKIRKVVISEHYESRYGLSKDVESLLDEAGVEVIRINVRLPFIAG